MLMDIKHNMVVDRLKMEWEQHALHYSAEEILSLLDWTHDYQKLKKFGIKVDEVENGFKVLVEATQRELAEVHRARGEDEQALEAAEPLMAIVKNEKETEEFRIAAMKALAQVGPNSGATVDNQGPRRLGWAQ